MKNLIRKILREDFNPYDDKPLTSSEELFGKQTRLEKQFSKIVIDGLSGNNSEYWSTFNALKIEIKDTIGKDDDLYKEFMHRIVEEENPTKVMNDLLDKLFRLKSDQLSGEQHQELNRLLTKLNSF